MTPAIDALLWMLIGHALCDGPLQGDYIARMKCREASALLAHAAIHAGAVRLATGSWLLAGAEFAAHATIDHYRCTGRLSRPVDQGLHVACKVVWAGLLFAGLTA